MLHQTGVFEINEFAGVIGKHQTDPGFRRNENVKILTQN